MLFDFPFQLFMTKPLMSNRGKEGYKEGDIFGSGIILLRHEGSNNMIRLEESVSIMLTVKS